MLRRDLRILFVAWGCLATCLWIKPAGAQQGTESGQWREHGGDLGHTQYAPLDQINETNVNDLEIAWRWKSVDEDLKESKNLEGRTYRIYKNESTPLMIDGVL